MDLIFEMKNFENILFWDRPKNKRNEIIILLRCDNEIRGEMVI